MNATSASSVARAGGDVRVIILGMLEKPDTLSTKPRTSSAMHAEPSVLRGTGASQPFAIGIEVEDREASP